MSHNWPSQLHEQYLRTLDERDANLRRAELMELGLHQIAAGKTIDEFGITDSKAFANAWLDWVERVMVDGDNTDRTDEVHERSSESPRS